MKSSFLNSPYPGNYGRSENLKVGLAIGLFVSLFLLVFKPFGIRKFDPPLWTYFGYGVVTFLGIVIVHYTGPKVFPKFFAEKTYTVWKELLMSFFLVIIIGLGNALFNHWFIERSSLAIIIGMIFNTFLVGIFPLTFLSLLEYNRQLKKNLKTSEEIKLPIPSEIDLTEKTQEKKEFRLSSEDQKTTILATQLLYVESLGNYANVVQFQDDNLSRNLYRTTLKALEEENKLGNIIRCHRSYIVNLDQVIEVTGNAQGLKLHLQNCKDIIPVSRKYIPIVKARFEQMQ